jgi:hypothetical protein
MDKATKYGEPLAYYAAQQMEAKGIGSLDAGKTLVAVGLSRIRASLGADELRDELNELSAMLAAEADAV